MELPWPSGSIAIMDSDGGADGPRKRRRVNPPGTEPYVLQELVSDIPVAAEASEEEVYISCVESWSMYETTSRKDARPTDCGLNYR